MLTRCCGSFSRSHPHTPPANEGGSRLLGQWVTSDVLTIWASRGGQRAANFFWCRKVVEALSWSCGVRWRPAGVAVKSLTSKPFQRTRSWMSQAPGGDCKTQAERSASTPHLGSVLFMERRRSPNAEVALDLAKMVKGAQSTADKTHVLSQDPRVLRLLSNRMVPL